MVAEIGRTILRLPLYHCNLIPIEMVWTQVKEYVTANNKTFKSLEIKELLVEGLELVTPEAWKNCIEHIITEESKMYKLDNVAEYMLEEFIITANTGSPEMSSLSDGFEL
ncbi:hypothetical protein Trydic_g15932 [Trypoxylus dichotomus]